DGGALGSLSLLNSHRVVYPLLGDSLDPDPLGIRWILADWCDQCHRKGGLVLWCPFVPGPLPLEQTILDEGLADLILGKVDALEATVFGIDHDIGPEWYGLLNCGLRVPLAGGSAKMSNLTPLGSVRTYAHVPPNEQFSYRGWIEAVRAGRTFITNAPLLTFSVNGQFPGAVVKLPEPGPLAIVADAKSIVPFEHLEIVHNGQVMASAAANGPLSHAHIETEIVAESSGWCAARCRGQTMLTSGCYAQPVAAHTSPVYVEYNDRAMAPNATELAALAQQMDQMLETMRGLEEADRFASPTIRERLTRIIT